MSDRLSMTSATPAAAPGWRKDAGARVEGSRALDSAKVQAPCVIRLPSGGFRLYYTAVGPSKPFRHCQGYILSAVSDHGLLFRKEPGIRLAPDPALADSSLRVLAPTIAAAGTGRWRMYFESRGTADRATVIGSAVSDDLLHWTREPGIRFRSPGGVGGPRFLPVSGGGGRLYCTCREFGPGGLASAEQIAQGVVSAVTCDGLQFEREPGYRLLSGGTVADSASITAAEVLPVPSSGGIWTMFYSAWEDVAPGTEVPPHPSADPEAVADGRSADFAAASIASDMAGFRSRIFVAHSEDGLDWTRGACVIEGDGHDGESLDAVHAEDMSLIELEDGTVRMFYAACDATGTWRIASALRSFS